MLGIIKNILIVDDDIEFATALASLMPTHYHTKTAFTLKQASELLNSYPFDSVITDFVLSDNDGFDFLRIIQTLETQPKVFFMTAFADKQMAISLLNQGVQGLIEKPFDVKDLTALLEKDAKDSIKDTQAVFVDPSKRRVVTPSGSYDLTEVEFKVVSYLMNQGQWVTREQLIQFIWGDSHQSRNTLDTHLSNLKKKIPGLKKSLKVVRGRGYFLEANFND